MAILGRSGPSCGDFQAAWARRGAILGSPEAVVVRFGALLGRLGTLSGRPGTLLGRPRAVLERKGISAKNIQTHKEHQ